MKLKRQGYFKEMPCGKKSDPSILQFIREKGDIEEERICQYLKSGMVLVACGGVAKDIINPDNGISGVPNVMTDGIWVWPGDLAYYVKKYHLELDKAFIMTMKNNDWHVKELFDIDFDGFEVV